MNIYLFLYSKWADFEVIQALLLLNKFPLITVGLEKGLVISESNLKVPADISIDLLDCELVDVFIIPGGEPKNILKDKQYSAKIQILNQKLNRLNNTHKLIAAICGGPTFLAYSGILENKKCTGSIATDEECYFISTQFTNSDLEMDGNIITAKGNAFTEFAIELGRQCNVIKNNAEAQETLNWFRNIK